MSNRIWGRNIKNHRKDKKLIIWKIEFIMAKCRRGLLMNKSKNCTINLLMSFCKVLSIK